MISYRMLIFSAGVMFADAPFYVRACPVFFQILMIDIMSSTLDGKMCK